MPIKYKKKQRHYRGSRQCGWGTQGHHRKKGMIGGRGNTGLQKHKWTWTTKHDPDYFGKHGFKRPQCTVETIETINIKDIEEHLGAWEASDQVSKKGSTYEIDLGALGYQKLLSTGSVNGKYNITVDKASATAIEKITSAGGTVTTRAEQKE